MTRMNEDTLVQRTTAEYLRDELGWNMVFAYNEETFGAEGTLGRKNDREVVLTRYLGEKIMELNRGLPMEAYREAIRQVVEYNAAQSALSLNRDKYALLRDGVAVSFRNEKNELVKKRLRLFDFDNPTENHFLVVRELWVRGDLYRRRADVVGFVNGIPLLFMELKNVHKDTRAAYEQNLSDYKDTVPHLFHHNAFVVLANGIDAKIGSISSRYKHFTEWKRLAEDEPGVVDMETLLKGVCAKRAFMDLFENFILFDESSGKLVKVVARNHQFLGVNRALSAVRERWALEGKLGVFWHTQGSGKSFSMAFFTQKIHRKIGGHFTFLILTDREDLDSQIYKTLAGCGLADNEKNSCRPESGKALKAMLGEHKTYLFSLIQKFNQDVEPGQPYSDRNDIIVITDEAHRTQYGRLALNLRNALPNASYIGFTGTPLFKDDEITRRVFGDYVSKYDFKRAIEDKATVPLYYDSRGEKLGVDTSELNEKIAKKIEELEIDDLDVEQRLERELKRDYHIITAGKRLERIARDFVTHYSTAWETGKAMFICIDKITCVRMHDLIRRFWTERIEALRAELEKTVDEQSEIDLHRQIDWMGQTLMAVVVSEEQGEVEKFRKWDLDITLHRRLMKEGFETADGRRIPVDEAFKKEDHPFRVVIVCAMWLTGFDVPSLANLYLDKPLQAHTLMQAIARANRVSEGKNNGLIIDYCGILKNLRRALATFATGQEGGGQEEDPARPDEELLADLAESVGLVRTFLAEGGFRLDEILEKKGFALNAAILKAKEVANENDITRKRFEILARNVFLKFKACRNHKSVNRYRHDYDAINIIYKSLQRDRDRADISEIIRELHEVVDAAVAPQDHAPDNRAPYDISKIDFDRLRQEFQNSKTKRTTVQNLRQAIEQRLSRMIEQNPRRTDFQRHFEEIIDEYNKEKDRATIEKTFQDLLLFMGELDEETHRAIREGLNDETIALFDILMKPTLEKKDVGRVKQVAGELLETLKAEKLRINHWREKESTRDAVLIAINDFLWNDQIGLPESYSNEEVQEKTEEVFRHVWRAYPEVPSPLYHVH